jgi:hypothetical protein
MAAIENTLRKPKQATFYHNSNLPCHTHAHKSVSFLGFEIPDENKRHQQHPCNTAAATALVVCCIEIAGSRVLKKRLAVGKPLPDQYQNTAYSLRFSINS